MLIKQTKDMTDSERIAAENSNNLFLKYLYDSIKKETTSEITDDTPDDFYPNVRALKEFISQFAADYIVEQGTITIDDITWTYEKWQSGKARCWGVSTQSIAIANIWGNGMYYGDGKAVAYPFDFVEPPICRMEKHTYASLSILEIGADGTASQTKVPRLICVKALSAEDNKISFNIIGKWK